jgi:hypothetical protein
MMTYEESFQLMADLTFRGRCKVACLKLAEVILAEAATVVNHNARLRWANQAFQNPDMAAGQVQSPAVMDPLVQAQGSAVTDVDLQTAVNTVVDKLLSSQ